MESWAIVELMGHVKLAGRLTEEEKFGAKMGRLDIPTETTCECCGGSGDKNDSIGCHICGGKGAVDSFVSQYFGGGSVYRITFVTEDVARHVCKSTTPEPVRPWEFPKPALPAATIAAPVAGSSNEEEEGDDASGDDF